MIISRITATSFHRVRRGETSPLSLHRLLSPSGDGVENPNVPDIIIFLSKSCGSFRGERWLPQFPLPTVYLLYHLALNGKGWKLKLYHDDIAIVFIGLEEEEPPFPPINSSVHPGMGLKIQPLPILFISKIRGYFVPAALHDCNGIWL